MNSFSNENPASLASTINSCSCSTSLRKASTAILGHALVDTSISSNSSLALLADPPPPIGDT